MFAGKCGQIAHERRFAEPRRSSAAERNAGETLRLDAVVAGRQQMRGSGPRTSTLLGNRFERDVVVVSSDAAAKTVTRVRVRTAASGHVTPVDRRRTRCAGSRCWRPTLETTHRKTLCIHRRSLRVGKYKRAAAAGSHVWGSSSPPPRGSETLDRELPAQMPPSGPIRPAPSERSVTLLADAGLPSSPR